MMAINRVLHRHGAFLCAVGKVMMNKGVSAPVATQGSFSTVLVAYMMQEGLSITEAQEQLMVELSEACNAQV
jgi:hypothetical protein